MNKLHTFNGRSLFVPGIHHQDARASRPVENINKTMRRGTHKYVGFQRIILYVRCGSATLRKSLPMHATTISYRRLVLYIFSSR